MRMLSPGRTFALAAAIAGAAAGPALEAHVVTRGAGTAAVVMIQEGKVRITLDLGFAEMWGQAEMVGMDADRNGEVDQPEAEAFMKKAWEKRLSPFLGLRIDGRKLPLQLLSSREDNLLGEVSPVAFDIYYELEAELPPDLAGPGNAHRLEIENLTLRNESPTEPYFYIPMGSDSHDPRISFQILEPPQLIDLLGAGEMYTMAGRKLVVKYDLNEGREPAGATEAAKDVKDAPLPEKEPPRGRAIIEKDAEQPEDRFFTDALRDYRRLGFWAKLGLIFLAMAYGAGHALAPGHGKAIVAAYLVGTRGRIRDAVVLGLATMFSHTITVFLAGLGIYLAVAYGAAESPTPIKNRIVVGTSLLSGVLLFLMGLVLFFRRWRYAGDPEAMAHSHGHHHHGHHHHGHDDHHHHEHGDHEHVQAAAPPATFWSLVGIGTSGGLVPCPAGIVVILLGLHFQDQGALLFSLLLLCFFSLALGSVLVAIGIFVVTGRRVLEGRVKVNQRLLSYVPALSSLFIAGLGTYFTVRTFQTGKTEIAAMLRSLAEAIGA